MLTQHSTREAARLAVEEMIDFLVTEKHLTRDDAYMLTSVAADLSITQLVDGNKGVHAMIARAFIEGPGAPGSQFRALTDKAPSGSQSNGTAWAR